MGTSLTCNYFMACKCNQIKAFKRYFERNPVRFCYELMDMGPAFFDRKICLGKKACIKTKSKIVYISFDDPPEEELTKHYDQR